jgi:hypothetical protein
MVLGILAFEATARKGTGFLIVICYLLLAVVVNTTILLFLVAWIWTSEKNPSSLHL